MFINSNKINHLELIKKLNKKQIQCGVGSCPEIYKEKVFKKLNLFPKERLPVAKILGETSLMFPIYPYKDLKKNKIGH